MLRRLLTSALTIKTPFAGRSLIAATLAAGTLLVGTAAAPASAFGTPAVNRYVVTFHDGVDAHAMASAMTQSGLFVPYVFGTLFSGVAVDLTTDQATALAADPSVALIEADSAVTASETQSGANWALSRIDQSDSMPDGAFTYPTSAGSGVVVYLVDSGLDLGTTIRNLQHLDFSGRIAGGNTWVHDGWGTDDCSGHGTHVAGTIAGTTHGVAKLATLISARVLECNDRGRMSDVVAALDWIHASRDRAKPTVVNMSLSGPTSHTLDNVVNRLVDTGVVVVAAAGNDGANACGHSPSSSDRAIAVGATNSSDYREQFSNYGPCVDLFAPGTFIESASAEDTSARRVSGGTSSSAAFVSGAAALILSENPGLSPDQVRDRILADATSGVVLNPGEGSANALLRIR